MQDLLQVAEKQDIRNAKEIMEQILTVVSQWEKYAQKYKVKTEFAKIIRDNLILKP